MSKKLVYRNDLPAIENSENNKAQQAASKFITNTNIAPLAVITKANLQKIKEKKNAFLLENITATDDISGKINCDSVFDTFLKKRQKTSFNQRVKDGDNWSGSCWWFLIIGVVLLFISQFLLNDKAQQYRAEDKQLSIAKEFVEKGSWYESRIPGPLDINLNEWKESIEMKKTSDSLILLRDSLTKSLTDNDASFKEAANQQARKLEDRRAAIYDSVTKDVIKQAQVILNKARDSVQNNKMGQSYFQSQQKIATEMYRDVDSLAKLQTKTIQKKIDSLKSYAGSSKSVEQTHALQEQIKSIVIPSYEKYKYDLMNPETETSQGWNIFMWIFRVIGMILVLIFIGICIHVLVTLPKVNAEIGHNYYDTLRAMAFPGRHSSNRNDYTCKISFHSMSEESKRLLRSVVQRYKWNVLADEMSFEFNEILRNSEALTMTQKRDSLEPLLFVYEDEYVIIYAGLGDNSDLQKDEEIIISSQDTSNTKQRSLS